MNIDSTVIRTVLREFYEARKYVYFDELRIGTGWGKDSCRTMDAWAIHEYPSKGNLHIAFEIKVSRSDFSRELCNPGKRKHALLFSNEFYFVAPEGVLMPKDMPPEAGLIEIGKSKYEDTPALNFVAAAPFRESFRPSWRFVAALARRIPKAGTVGVNL